MSVQADRSETRFRVVLVNPEPRDPEGVARPIREAGGWLETAVCSRPDEVIAAAQGARGLIIRALREQADRVFESLPDLAVVGRMGIGVDSLDVAAATRHGVCVVNVPSFCEEEVADHAMALLLACARRLVPDAGAVRAGEWPEANRTPLRRLRGQTLGLAGFGKIARLVAARGRAFGLRVKAHDPHAPAAAFAAAGAEPVSFPDLLAQSDFISIHCPLLPETRGLFGASALARMKPTAFLINTARGAIVDEEALVSALQDGRLAGAGLDVSAQEPPPADHPLRRLENVVLTPHTAWYSEEAVAELDAKIGRYMAQAILGERPESLVNPEAWGKRAGLKPGPHRPTGG
jgi:D-3-phosphoglycerate dehydrogenase